MNDLKDKYLGDMIMKKNPMSSEFRLLTFREKISFKVSIIDEIQNDVILH